jgi:hypothetical protein
MKIRLGMMDAPKCYQSYRKYPEKQKIYATEECGFGLVSSGRNAGEEFKFHGGSEFFSFFGISGHVKSSCMKLKLQCKKTRLRDR